MRKNVPIRCYLDYKLLVLLLRGETVTFHGDELVRHPVEIVMTELPKDEFEMCDELEKEWDRQYGQDSEKSHL